MVEYTTAKFIAGNVVEVASALPYRVNDNVRAQNGTTEATVESIQENRFLYLSNPLDANTTLGDAIYIVNKDKDSESYIEDTFKIDQLESLNDHLAEFGLISWLQYFRVTTPKRKYYKNTCQWAYKGPECQYPGHGGLSIPGTSLTSNANPIAANNEIASDAAGDICGKSIQACTLRNNQIHFGGFLQPDEQSLNRNIKGCILPWIHLHGDIRGEYALCCHTDSYFVNNRVIRTGNHSQSPLEVWNGDAMKAARLKFLNDDYPEECSVCYDKEAVVYLVIV